jgi:GNAT superfamily N-acetyltransferase
VSYPNPVVRHAEVYVVNGPHDLNLDAVGESVLRAALHLADEAGRSLLLELGLHEAKVIVVRSVELEVHRDQLYELDYDQVLPLIAIHNGRIVGDATLHFSHVGWTKHQGEIRLTTDPRYREKGLGTILLEDLIDIATDLGLEQLSAEIPPVLDKAFYLFEKLGFEEVANLKGFVRDLEGNESDLVLMTKSLS